MDLVLELHPSEDGTNLLHPSDLSLADQASEWLAKEHIYSQTFFVPDALRAAFEAHITSYTDYMLNELGLYFYQSTWFHSMETTTPLKGGEEGERRWLFTIQFSLFSLKHFVTPSSAHPTSMKEAVETPEFLKLRLYPDLAYDPAQFKAYILAEQATYYRSRVYRPQHMPDHTVGGDIDSLGLNPCTAFFRWWLVVPGVQYRFFDLLYQLYTFDIAHQGFWPKFLHVFTIPANVITTMTFLAQWKFVEGYTPEKHTINASFIYLCILMVAYMAMGFMRRSIVWGFTTCFLLLCLWEISNLWYDYFAVPGNPVYNPTTWFSNPLIWMYVSSLVESFSHLLVPQLPPYTTGFNHWESPITFVCKGKLLYVLSGIVSGLVFAPAVSYISHPHLIGTLTIVVMFGLGYQNEFYSEYKRMVLKAELSGNPALDKVPLEFDELIHGAAPEAKQSQPKPKKLSAVEQIMLWTGVQHKDEKKLPSFLATKIKHLQSGL